MRWVRRKPAAAALIATAIALLGMLAAFGLREWSLAIRRQAQAERVSARLHEVIRLQEEGRFDEARASLPDATMEPIALQHEVEQVRAELKLVEQLDEIRMNRGRFVRGGGIDYAASSRQYEELFREAGIARVHETVAQVAERLKQSPICAALISALDDWAVCADWQRRLWVLSVVRAMDPDPWRDQVRDPLRWDNVRALPKLAEEANIDEQPVKLLVAFGTRWRRLGGDPHRFSAQGPTALSRRLLGKLRTWSSQAVREPGGGNWIRTRRVGNPPECRSRTLQSGR